VLTIFYFIRVCFHNSEFLDAKKTSSVIRSHMPNPMHDQCFNIISQFNNGILHGEYREKDQNNCVLVEGVYCCGKKHGVWVEKAESYKSRNYSTREKWENGVQLYSSTELVVLVGFSATKHLV
jgi:hypothetical protein